MRRHTTTERIVRANGVDLCTEPFGNPADPPVLLVMGIGASMLWWEEDFCRMLAGGGSCSATTTATPAGRSPTTGPSRL